MARIIGIDLGSHSVKLAVMTGAFGRFEIEEYLSEDLPNDDRSMDKRLECLSALLAGLPTDERLTMAAGFPAEDSSVRMVSLPFSDKKQIDQTLGFEVEGQVPFDLEDMVLTHRIIDTGPEGSRVLAALSDTERVGGLLSKLDENSADPKSLVIDGDMLGDHASSGVQAIIDIGHQRTVVTICSEGHVWGTRGIGAGGAQLTEALAEANQLSFENAEALKHRTILRSRFDAEAEWEDEPDTQVEVMEDSLEPPSPGDSETIRTALQPLLSSLRTTLINFEDTLGIEVSEVLLCGGTANLGGLVRLLKVDLGVRVRLIAVSDLAHTSGRPARFALCHSLARRAAGISSGEEMELRSGPFKFRGDMASARTAVIGGGIAMGLGVLMCMGFVAWKVMQTNARLAEIDTQIAEVVASVYQGELDADEVGDHDEALKKLQLKALETMELIQLLGPAVALAPPTVSTMHDLSLAMPPSSKARIDVRELTISQKSLNIDAETDTYDSASTIEASIQAHQRFSQATKGDDKKVRDGIRFTISIPLQDSSTTEDG
jgi:general secretion pathway protein L